MIKTLFLVMMIFMTGFILSSLCTEQFGIFPCKFGIARSEDSNLKGDHQSQEVQTTRIERSAVLPSGCGPTLSLTVQLSQCYNLEFELANSELNVVNYKFTLNPKTTSDAGI